MRGFSTLLDGEHAVGGLAAPAAYERIVVDCAWRSEFVDPRNAGASSPPRPSHVARPPRRRGPDARGAAGDVTGERVATQAAWVMMLPPSASGEFVELDPVHRRVVFLRQQVAMPLWGSMTSCRAPRRSCGSSGTRPLLRRSIALKLWRLRHSSESDALIRRHCSWRSAPVLPELLLRVDSPPKWRRSSCDCLDLAHDLVVHSLGTWQSEQIARTPVRFW